MLHEKRLMSILGTPPNVNGSLKTYLYLEKNLEIDIHLKK